MSPGLSLILLSVIPALIGAAVLMVSIDRDLDLTTSSGALAALIYGTAFFVANTLFFIGCVAEGVRIGTQRE